MSSTFLLLFAFLTVAYSCPRSLSIYLVDDIKTCNGSNFLLKFTYQTNFTDGLECVSGRYRMHIFTHNFNLSTADQLTEAQPPVHDNVTNMCTSYLIIPDMTYKKYHGKLLQIWMHHTKIGSLHCSNNFTAIIGTDPPDPVNTSSIVSIVNCTGVYLYWTPPVTPTGCNILNYTLKWNDMVVTIEEPFYSWPAAELPSDEVLTVGIKAFNGIGPSQETSINISTAVEPVVNIVNHTLIIVPSAAQLTVNAKLDSEYCPFSFPSLLHICTMCNDTSPFCSYINLTVYNDVMITISTSLPLDLLQCVSNLTWLNLYSSYISYINDTFSTSPVHSVFIPTNSSTGYFRINCTLLPGGSGCAIKVFNSSDFFFFIEFLNEAFIVSDDDYKVLSKTTTHQLTANGMYTVFVHSLKDSNSVGDVVITSRIIEVALPLPSPSHTLLPSPSHTSSSSPTCEINCSNSNSPGNNNSKRNAIIIGIVVAVVVAIAVMIFVAVLLMYCLFRKRHRPPRISSGAQDGKNLKLTSKKEYSTPEGATTRHHSDITGASSDAPLLDRETLITPYKDIEDVACKPAAQNHDPVDELYIIPEQSDTNGLESVPVTGIDERNIPSDDTDGKKEVTTETGMPEETPDRSKKHIFKESAEPGVNRNASKCTLL